MNFIIKIWRYLMGYTRFEILNVSKEIIKTSITKDEWDKKLEICKEGRNPDPLPMNTFVFVNNRIKNS